jgi:Asp-tRNA(Asn)/Glu-tRNA(Gln) amidotransferase C subunit|tara:strand:+ start:486 stop:1364 length:879 start_codon:yes stop_codon:yes gene_type:complete
MTDKENASEEAKKESKPNPYNMNKTWHTADVMPQGAVESADSLFVAPAKKADDQQDDEPVAKKATPYKKVEHNWKKRYDDLKTLRDNELGKWRNREQELISEATASRPEYVAPKTIEELERFKAQYPDVYDVVETVSHLQGEAQVEELTSKISALEAREAEVLHREAESELLNKHPDFADIRDSDEFHDWAKEQPDDIQAWVYNNPNNVGLASRAIDMFKLDTGVSQKQTRSKSKRSNSKAADMVSTKTTTVESTGQPKIWTQEEIAALPMDEFDRLEGEIDLAMEEGRVRL